MTHILVISFVIVLVLIVSLFMLEALILLIHKRFNNTELVKTISISKHDWFYLIPTIGFTKTKKFLEVEITWFGYCIYIAYQFDKIV